MMNYLVVCVKWLALIIDYGGHTDQMRPGYWWGGHCGSLSLITSNRVFIS